MAISVFDIFKIGIGPSSSHTVGPMRAARMFTKALFGAHPADIVSRIAIELYGSLGATGKGHSTDTAIILGLAGHDPETVNVDQVPSILDEIRSTNSLPMACGRAIRFDERHDILFRPSTVLPFHPNGMRCIAYGALDNVLFDRLYYSVGGGFVVQETANETVPSRLRCPMPLSCPCRFEVAPIYCTYARNTNVRWQTSCGITRRICAPKQRPSQAWLVSGRPCSLCVDRGCRSTACCSARIKVRRRAPELLHKLEERGGHGAADPLLIMDYVNLYALAVNEENAAGGRVVTAPTNGAAGIVPAVLHYYHHFIEGSSKKGVHDFLLTAAAIGILYKENASISGAEVGCQGEVGVACSMAAAGLCAVLSGTPEQVENAAEIGMEHHLGLTCDPVGGLVQIPCIERNAIAAVKAINAARMALNGDGVHSVSLDQAIKTMRETGADMLSKYKETSQGGLAVNIVEC